MEVSRWPDILALIGSMQTFLVLAMFNVPGQHYRNDGISGNSKYFRMCRKFKYRLMQHLVQRKSDNTVLV